MKLKFIFAIFFLLLFFAINVKAQTIKADRTTICKGDDTPVILTIEDAPVGFNLSHIWNSGACTFTCISLVRQGSIIEGPNIISQTAPPSFSCGNPEIPVHNVVCRVSPTETTTYTYSYDQTILYPTVIDEDCNADHALSISENLGTIQITIEVIDPPIPNLTSTKTIFLPNEPVQLEIDNCVAFSYAIALRSTSLCETKPEMYNSSYACQSDDTQLFYVGNAPNQPTTIEYQAQFYTTINDEICKSDFGDKVTVNVVPSPADVAKCANYEALENAYSSKEGTPNAPYARQSWCLAAKSCVQYGWNGAFVNYSFDWLESHTNRINGADVACPETLNLPNFVCMALAGNKHIENELEPLFYDYCKFITTEFDLEQWTEDHENFIMNVVSPCFNELKACEELSSFAGTMAENYTKLEIRKIRAEAQAYCRLKMNPQAGNLAAYLESLPLPLTKEELYSTDIANENTLLINESQFFIKVGESLDLQVSSLNQNEGAISYALSVEEDIATVDAGGVLRIHNTFMPLRNSRALIYVLARQGDNFAIGQYAIYDEDTDNDGIVNTYETKVGLNPMETNEFESDIDNDGSTDFLEVMLRTNPLIADTDGDGATDGQEYNDDTDPLDVSKFLCGESFCYKDCETDLHISTVEFSSYKAKSITSNALIESTDNKKFEATESITLQEDFHAQAGSEFLATISDCQPDNVGRKNLPIDSFATFDKVTTPIENTQLVIFPNPSSGAVNIELSASTSQRVSCSIFDITGKKEKDIISNKFLNKGIHNFTTSLKSGLYIIKYLDGKEYITKKLLVQL